MAWTNRGITLGELERYAEAVESYDKAIVLKPERFKDWGCRGEMRYWDSYGMQKRVPHHGQSGPLQGTSAVLKFSGSFTISKIEFFSIHHRDTMMLYLQHFQIMPWSGRGETVPA
jgi:hypothetical protein